MDFLKTLMLYMALTTATAVQGAEPAAQVLPQPTAVVIEATAEPAATPVPTFTPTPTPAAPKAKLPSPTVAPSKKYSLLSKGKKGEDVRRLQLRLKDLGFLKGNIDGSYGNGTRSAVLAFQKANGLEADGDAGRATLTLLYENPYLINAAGELVAVNADGSIATAEPTATPEPALEDLQAPGAVPTPVPLTLTPIDGASVVYNESGEALSALKLSDGVTVRMEPHVFNVSNGTTAVSLSDLCYIIDGWELSIQDSVVLFSAEGYDFAFSPEGDTFICETEEEGFPCQPGDLIIDGTDVAMRTGFLGELLNGTSLWEPEEKTLLLRFAGR